MKVLTLDAFLCEYYKTGEAIRVDAKLLQEMIAQSNRDKIQLRKELQAMTVENEGLKQTIKILKNGQESFLDLKA